MYQISVSRRFFQTAVCRVDQGKIRHECNNSKVLTAVQTRNKGSGTVGGSVSGKRMGRSKRRASERGN